MNVTKDITCVNCGSIMKTGGTSISPRGFSQYRHCTCGLELFLFTSDENDDVSLIREKKHGRDQEAA